MRSKIATIHFILGITLLLTFSLGCAKSLKTGCSDASCVPSENQTTDVWRDVDLKGIVAGGPVTGASVIDFDKINQTISLEIPIPENPLGSEMSGDIPQIPGATFGVFQDSAGKWYVGVKIPIKYLIKGISIGEARKLPSGDPLPGVPGGELPVVGIKISKIKDLDIYLYLGVNAAAIFVPTPQFNPFVSLTFPIKNQSQKKVIGYFATVAEKGTFSGGFYVSTVIPDALARIIDSIL